MYPGTHAASSPDRPALIMGGTGETVSYRQLDERSNALAHLFRAADLQRGDHVALFMENQARFMEVVWAALRSGLYITCVNSHLTGPEVSYIVEDCGAKALVTSAAKSEVARELDPGALKAVKTRLMVDGTVPGFDAYEDA